MFTTAVHTRANSTFTLCVLDFATGVNDDLAAVADLLHLGRYHGRNEALIIDRNCTYCFQLLQHLLSSHHGSNILVLLLVHDLPVQDVHFYVLLGNRRQKLQGRCCDTFESITWPIWHWNVNREVQRLTLKVVILIKSYQSLDQIFFFAPCSCTPFHQLHF